MNCMGMGKTGTPLVSWDFHGIPMGMGMKCMGMGMKTWEWGKHCTL